MTPTHNTSHAATIIDRCRELAHITDVPNETTRLYLSPATRDAHTLLTEWFHQANLTTRTDDAGNLRALRPSAHTNAPTFLLFSHIDTVPNAGAFDGPLGILLALAAIEELADTPLPFHIELIAFAEEEGARFGFPFLSSLAATGQLTLDHLARTDADGITVAQAIRSFAPVGGRRLNPDNIPQTCPLIPNTFAALEVHIEQGPVLESREATLGPKAAQLAVVDSIVGQSRLELTFTGQANHAGTTPMHLRHDALAAAAQWIVEVERYATSDTQLVATVGRITALPGATNIIPGTVHTTLDVRHPSDAARYAAVTHLLTEAEQAATLRGVTVRSKELASQRTVPMDRSLTDQLHQAAARAGFNAKPIFSGAGHDAMVLASAAAPAIPTTMLFLRSPNGLSHHPNESVREQDVEAALATVLDLLLHLHP